MKLQFANNSFVRQKQRLHLAAPHSQIKGQLPALLQNL
jgi:hypothetical protein